MINDFIFYVEQNCTLSILNPVLMLEHASTEYYVSICFVNLLYSNCSLPEVNDEIQSVHIHLLKIKLDTF